MESLVTQTLIIFAIRTHRPLFKSRPHKLLEIAALGITAAAVILPYTHIGVWLGFVPLPVIFFGFLVAALAAYILLVEAIKHVFRRVV